MVESTARRERVEQQRVSTPAYLWEVPQKPVAVRLTFDLIDRLEHEVLENFRSLTSRGSETGGLLLGSVAPGAPLFVSVRGFSKSSRATTRGVRFIVLATRNSDALNGPSRGMGPAAV